jgi:hypothetical protein
MPTDASIRRIRALKTARSIHNRIDIYKRSLSLPNANWIDQLMLVLMAGQFEWVCGDCEKRVVTLHSAYLHVKAHSVMRGRVVNVD